MSKRFERVGGAICGLVLLLTACGGARMTTQPISQPTALAQQATPTEERTSEPQVIGEPIVLRVWWPDVLAPTGRASSVFLQEQIERFQAANPDIEVELRIKRVGEAGGIMSTLRTAWAVAPGALPDLTLLRRNDLLTAGRAGLLRTLSSEMRTELDTIYPAAVALGQVDGEAFGVPFLLDLDHMAYDPAAVRVESWRFEDLLTTGVSLMFPVGRPGALNTLFLAQYSQLSTTDLATPEAGGVTAVLDRDALLRLFTFYADASAAGLIDPLVLETAAPSDYAADLASGAIPAALVTSTLYLQLLDAEIRLAAAPLPTESGEPTAILNGWIWVNATTDSARQSAAARLLAWLMDAERQSAYARVVDMLPSQPAALRRWEAGEEPLADYAAFVQPLLANAIPLPGEEQFGAAGRAIQSALAGVLSGQYTPQAAVDEVLAQVGG